MKYSISSLGFWSKNVTSILNKNILLLKKKILMPKFINFLLQKRIFQNVPIY